MSTLSETPPRAHRPALPRTTFLVLAGLMVLSTALFLVGNASERRVPAAPTTGETHQETGGAPETHEASEATPAAPQEGAESREGQEAGTAEAPVFGINVESPGALGAVVLGTLLLIAALYYFGYPALVLVLLVALGGTVLDVREVIHQVAVSQAGIAAFAVVVALAHLSAAIVAILALRGGRSAPQVAASSK